MMVRNFNLSPQGDGNSRTFCRNLRKPSISTYPRKGTETDILRLRCYRLRHFNLSPQGDGNCIQNADHTSSCKFQLIPARGRKLLQIIIVFFLLWIPTYPRKGTETQSDSAEQTGTCYNLQISTYPRKGAKNSASKMVRSFSFACLNFSVFVGFFSMNRAAAAFSLPWLLYCDKMCYNRAKLKHLSQNTQLYSSFVVQLFRNL